MIYDLNFLKRGAIFPPRSEVQRLDAYRINAMLLDDEAWAALPEYQQRVQYLLSNFALESETVYLFTANYWSDIVKKNEELIYGDAPELQVVGREEDVKDILIATEMLTKAKEGVQDFCALGDWVTKLVETTDGWNVINVDPSTWFPVVSRENIKEIKMHVLAWIATVGKGKYELHVQIHEKGKYTNRAFSVFSYDGNSYYVVESTRQRIHAPSYELGVELSQSATDFKLGTFNTGLDDFAITVSANNPSTRKVYGTSDFDGVTDAIMEYNVRQTLKNVVLDKHSAPKLYGPPLIGDNGIGNYLEVDTGGQTPGYLVWDASMQSVETTINAYKDDIANLSGLGSLLNSKTFGESQGYDALMIKLAPALMRSSAKKRILEKHLKKVLSLLSGKYGEKIDMTDISVMWHDGIPTTETVRADIAAKHLATGWSKKRVLMDDYGFNEETADAIIEEARLETPAMPAFGMYEDEPQTETQGGDNDE
jgi:hypothetical protein